MMRALIVLALLVSSFSSCEAGRNRLKGGQRARVDESLVAEEVQAAAEKFEQAEILKMEIEQADVAAGPVSADRGVSYLGMALIFVFICACNFYALALLEKRRQSSADVWLANRKTLAIYRGLTCMSVVQAGFAVLRIFDSDAFISGMIDLGSAILSFYVTQGGVALAYLPVYLLCAGVAGIIDVLVLLWDLEHWNGSWADVARPCLCAAGIVLGYHFLQEVRKVSQEKGKGMADRLLDMVLAFSLVQQAMCVIGMIEIDPLLSAGSGLNLDTIPTSESCLISQDKISDILREATRPTEDPKEHLDAEVGDMVHRCNEFCEPQAFEESTSQEQVFDSPSSQHFDFMEQSEAPVPLLPQAPVVEENPQFVAEFASDEVEDDLL